MSSPIYIALDTPDIDRAKELATAVRDDAGGLKLGLEFFNANGPSGIAEIARIGLPIFLDLKLHDIPNTVAKAMQSLNPLSPAIITIHTAGGRAMMEAAKDAAPAGTKVVGVTVLTSLDAGDLASVGYANAPREQVLHMADLARQSGLDGIVCSGAEVGDVHAQWQDGFFVVPGIRPADAALGDQKRAVTPREALGRGAPVLVIGRPVTGADDPAEALRAIMASL